MSEYPTNETIEVPYHGNCPDCHHFHTNTPLFIPKDPLQHHLRLHCDACGYPILGIGRTSTQTTLASVETLSTTQKTQRCDNKSVDAAEVPTLRIDPAPSQDQPRNEPLSAISEASSINIRSRSVSGSGSAEAAIGRPTGTVASNIATNEGTTVFAGREARTGSNVNVNATKKSDKNVSRAVRWKEKAKHVVPARLKSLLKARLRTRSRSPENLPAHAERGPTRRNVVDADTDTVSNVSLPPQVQPLTQTLSETQSPSLITAIDAVFHSSDQPHSRDNDTGSYRDKREKILTKRRERTAAKTTDVKIMCECTENCQCQQQRNRYSVSNDIDVPGHSLGHLISRSSLESDRSNSNYSTGLGTHENRLAGIGDHLAVGRPPSVDDDTRARVVRRNSRLSTATTAHGSTSSSISLNTGRAPGRSPSGVHGASHRQPYR